MQVIAKEKLGNITIYKTESGVYNTHGKTDAGFFNLMSLLGCLNRKPVNFIWDENTDITGD